VRAAADKAKLDISPFELVDAAHSHESAAKAVALVKAGRAEALMKGSLHTDELMAAVVSRSDGHPHRAPHQPLLHHGRARAIRRR
jgi:phosphate acetyltransferase